MSVEVTETGLNLIPAGYKQTEVGVIPEDWEIFSLGQSIAKTQLGGNYKNSEHDTGQPLIKMGNLDRGFVKLSKQEFIIGNASESDLLNYGDVLFNTRNTLELVGKVAIWKNELPKAYFNSNLMRISFKEDLVSSNLFMNALMNSERFIKALSDIAIGTTSVAAIYNRDLFLIKVALPTKKEQTAIANALSDVDALISELEKLIAKKQAIKTATMQQLLTGRTRLPQFALREDGSKKSTKQSELGEIPEDWEVMRLGHLAKFFKGSGLPKSELSESGKIKCIHYGQLFTTYGPKIDRVISRTENVGIVTSQENDVLMPTSDVTPNGLATASCITETGVTLGGDILIIRSDKQKLNGVFFSYLVNVLRDQVMQLVTGSTVYHLYGSDMAKFEFAFPSKEEQTAIATILSDMDEEIQALKQRLSKTRQIKQGMMQELLTGKTRLVQPLNKESQHG
ncbi:restriction endonuclease subunit S [Proteus mirabilis]|uniref:restriction endonuclease subunit S n=1 Tax=Proteus mirabilis TaxID=584 RepID=UPI0021821E70|nr:restriction endonuclease subunit S [Proteus mirabilis]MCT0064801.1 restriction endonuclease subunit S [Proteus mirabilis]